MSRPLLLDAFSCAGGASKGYHDAGFEVIGLDIEAQPHYPYELVRGDAIKLLGDRRFMAQFDAAHASPPCRDHTPLTSVAGLDGSGWLLAAVRKKLQGLDIPWVIENVPGAPMPAQDTLDGSHGVMLCGSMFGLGTAEYKLKRHRLFEPSCPVPQPPDRCSSDPRWTIGVYGKATRARGTTGPSLGMAEGEAAMGISWMTGDELSQAIPPAYTRYVGEFLLGAVQERQVAA